MLAAVNLVESAFGRMRNNSTAGAQGPMQFIPSTWAAYGMGGDVRDPRQRGHDRLLDGNRQHAFDLRDHPFDDHPSRRQPGFDAFPQHALVGGHEGRVGTQSRQEPIQPFGRVGRLEGADLGRPVLR